MFDVSEANGGMPFDSLSDALGDNGANIPSEYRVGGMSIKFILQLYTVAKTTSSEQPESGTSLTTDPAIVAGTKYKASDLNVFAMLPTTDAVVYYISDGAATPTYTIYTITKNAVNACEYMQYRYMSTAITNTAFVNIANWQDVEKQIKYLNSKVESLEQTSQKESLSELYLELGSLSRGIPIHSVTRARTKYFIYALQQITTKSGYLINEIDSYNQDGSFKSVVTGSPTNTFTYTGNDLLKIVFKRQDNGNIETDDLTQIVDVLIGGELQKLGERIEELNSEDIILAERIENLENVNKINLEYGTMTLDGTPSGQAQNRARFKDFCRDFLLTVNNGFLINEAYYYDSSKTFVSLKVIGSDVPFEYIGDGYVKLVFKKSDNSNIEDTDSIIDSVLVGEIFDIYSTANAAQSTANAAQSTANAAQSTANSVETTLKKEVLGGDFVIEMEYGNISTNGVPSTQQRQNRSRTKNFISGNFYVKVDTDFTLYEVYLYNQDETFDRVIYMSSGNREYTSDGTKLVKFCVKRNDNENISDLSSEIIQTIYTNSIKEDVNYLMNNTVTLCEFYEFTKQYERNRTLKDFIPYSVKVTDGSQTNRLNLLFFTDNHIDLRNPVQSLDNVKDTVTFLNSSGIQFDAVLNGGDAITPFDRKTKEEEKLVFKTFSDEIKKFSNVPVLFTKGNHDTNNWRNTPDNTFDDADWGEMWFNYAETTYGMVRQTKLNSQKSTWGYLDIPSKKVRIIVLDNQDVDNSIVRDNGDVLYYGSVAFYISNEQFNWVMETALNFDDKAEKDWGVIVLSHQSWTSGVNVTADNWVAETSYSVGAIVKYDGVVYRCTTANNDSVFNSSKWTLVNPEPDMVKFKNALVAFKNYTIYQENYSFSGDSFYNLSINADFTRYANLEKKPYFICWLVGHEHSDKYNVTDGITTIWTINGSATSLASDTKVARILGTPTQNAFDLLSIDLVDKKIRIVRYGAGVNCNGEGGNRFLPDGLSF